MRGVLTTGLPRNPLALLLYSLFMNTPGPLPFREADLRLVSAELPCEQTLALPWHLSILLALHRANQPGWVTGGGCGDSQCLC